MQITTATAKGLRPYQEDRFVVTGAAGGTLYAVMDGHGDDSVSDKVAQSLPAVWQKYSQVEPPNDPLLKTFASLHLRTARMHAGSTVSLALVTPDAARIAVLGDSPVVAKTKDGNIFVGPVHNARSNASELNAAQARGAIYYGGYIQAHFSGYGIQMTRVLGDRELHNIINRKPEISSVELGPGSFVLLGTDGLFDPSHQKVAEEVDAVVKLIEDGADAQALVDRAVAMPTGDNVTAILIRL